MDRLLQAAALLPEDYRQALILRGIREAEEIRLRTGRSPTWTEAGREHNFSERACREKDLLCVLDKACGASLHSVSETLRRGFLTVGGLRIGVCGVRNPAEGGWSFQRYSSLCLRLPHECRGIARDLIPVLRENAAGGTLIISPPGGGKTTLLRECIRCLSEGGLRIGVADERGELSGTENGEGGFDLGCRSDILIGTSKGEGCLQLLRCMNPQLIAMDEITCREDLQAAMQIAGCGTGILATAHATGVEQMRLRPLYREILEAGIFHLAVVISGSGRERRYSMTQLSS